MQPASARMIGRWAAACQHPEFGYTSLPSRDIPPQLSPCALKEEPTVTGLQFGLLLGGAVITETVFAVPGVASHRGRDPSARLPGRAGGRALISRRRLWPH